MPALPFAQKLLPALLLLSAFPVLAGQAAPSTAKPSPPTPEPALPDAPKPQPEARNPASSPCQIRRDAIAIAQAGAAGAMAADPAHPVLNASLQPESCPPLAPLIDWYARFLNGPQVKALTPRQKAWLATRNLLDPFNGLTILGLSAINVASNSHGPYGPGMTGFARDVGVTFTQEMTGQFFGTFLIPSIAHQDPHYHRLPKATMKRRIAHAIYQVAWTQGDNGKGMLNYADLVGFAIDDQFSNLYVPGRETNAAATASRYGIALATAPIDNFITEFLPDIARHLQVRVVLVQRIINRVANTGGTGP